MEGRSALTNHSHLGIWAEFSQVVMVFKEREVMLAANFGPARVSVDWAVALSPGSHPEGACSKGRLQDTRLGQRGEPEGRHTWWS